MDKQVVTFVFDQLTSRSARYVEDPDGPEVLGSLLVKQSALGQPLPERLVVTVQAADEGAE